MLMKSRQGNEEMSEETEVILPLDSPFICPVIVISKTGNISLMFLYTRIVTA
jgi:hypothetical protein